VHYLRVQQIAKNTKDFTNKPKIGFLTCATSSSTGVGGSLPLFMILVPVLIVDKKDLSKIEKDFLRIHLKT
jgi:uncharacterized membrane protein YfcA